MKMFVSLLAVLLLAQAAPPQAAPPPAAVDQAGREDAIREVGARLRERYMDPERGDLAADRIEAALAAGAYDQLTDARAFADRITADLYETTRDRHLSVFPAGQRPPNLVNAPPPPKSVGGIVRTDRLADGVGYIEIVGFPPPQVFVPSLDAAMAGLKDARALVVDLRRHNGGVPASADYFISYFLEPGPPVLLNTFVERRPGLPAQFESNSSWSRPTQFSFRGRPVYILTSARTFSGGEAVAYDMQARKLAILVGETTGGGANPGAGGPVTPQFSMFTPWGRPVHPITGSNWEGAGVRPDIVTMPEDALRTALLALGIKTPPSSIDDASREQLTQVEPFSSIR